MEILIGKDTYKMLVSAIQFRYGNTTNTYPYRYLKTNEKKLQPLLKEMLLKCPKCFEKIGQKEYKKEKKEVLE